jgi:hypothetical protein
MIFSAHKKSCDLGSVCSTSSEERDEELLTLKTNPLKHKTELCKNFSESANCPYGPRCRFAHGTHELVWQPSIKSFRRRKCNGFWMHGCCTYGIRCQFGHDELEWDTRAVILALSSIHADMPLEGGSKLLAILNCI